MNLAGLIDENLKPTAGVRQEVPDHLRVDFNELLSYGRSLYKTHGQGFKRHVKFDDRNNCLYMDIKLPGGDEWLLVDQKMAAEHAATVPGRSTAITRKRLTSSVSSAGSREGSMEGVEVIDVESQVQTRGELPKSKTLEKYQNKNKKARTEWE